MPMLVRAANLLEVLPAFGAHWGKLRNTAHAAHLALRAGSRMQSDAARFDMGIHVSVNPPDFAARRNDP